MTSRSLILLLGLTALLLNACGGVVSPITLAPDRPTFLFFFTDG